MSKKLLREIIGYDENDKVVGKVEMQRENVYSVEYEGQKEVLDITNVNDERDLMLFSYLIHLHSNTVKELYNRE